MTTFNTYSSIQNSSIFPVVHANGIFDLNLICFTEAKNRVLANPSAHNGDIVQP